MTNLFPGVTPIIEGTTPLVSTTPYFGEEYATAAQGVHELLNEQGASKDNVMLPDVVQLLAISGLPMSVVGLAAVNKARQNGWDNSSLQIGAEYELFTRDGFKYMEHVEKRVSSLSASDSVLGGKLLYRSHYIKSRRLIRIDSEIQEITTDENGNPIKPIRWYDISTLDLSPIDQGNSSKWRSEVRSNGIWGAAQLFIEGTQLKMVNTDKGGQLEVVFLGDPTEMDSAIAEARARGVLVAYQQILDTPATDSNGLKMLKHPEVRYQHKAQLVFWVVAKLLKPQLIAARADAIEKARLAELNEGTEPVVVTDSTVDTTA